MLKKKLRHFHSINSRQLSSLIKSWWLSCQVEWQEYDIHSLSSIRLAIIPRLPQPLQSQALYKLDALSVTRNSIQSLQSPPFLRDSSLVNCLRWLIPLTDIFSVDVDRHESDNLSETNRSLSRSNNYMRNSQYLLLTFSLIMKKNLIMMPWRPVDSRIGQKLRNKNNKMPQQKT